jgi:hypothetical protein
MGQMKAVSCNRQLPHILQPNNGPLTNRSIFLNTLLPNRSFLKGKNGGCHLRPGVKMDMKISYWLWVSGQV